MGSTAMEAVTGLNNRISNERGNWKEIILKNKTYPIMITFSPSFLLRFPENKKHSDTYTKDKHHKKYAFKTTQDFTFLILGEPAGFNHNM